MTARHTLLLYGLRPASCPGVGHPHDKYSILFFGPLALLHEIWPF
jgi:hypothetical protein